ncbi:MAG TPA: hypothetical protein VMM76_28570 [Pirellulaceae bacterium]|nr:hypothetical protein [Pirellulaceae bacterium]
MATDIERMGVGPSAAIIQSSLSSATSDPIYVAANTIKDVSTSDFCCLLSFGARDERRSANPLEFADATAQSFSEWSTSSKFPTVELSAVSSVGIDQQRSKAIHYVKPGQAEPPVGMLADMLELSAMLDQRFVTVVNFPFAGASVPQHAHTQILALRPAAGDLLLDHSLQRLFANIEDTSEMSTARNIRFNEVSTPMWGFRLRFPEGPSPAENGRTLGQILYRMRHRSQLRLSFNLYVPGGQSSEMIVVFRETSKERPFSLNRVWGLIAARANEVTADQIRNSDNGAWRWGWLECIGGLPARDASFADTETFNGSFWRQVYEIADYDKEYRDALRQEFTRTVQALG